MTRPLGASVADSLGKSAFGGLGLGDGPVALVLTAAIVVLVGYLVVSRADAPRPERATEGDPPRPRGQPASPRSRGPDPVR